MIEFEAEVVETFRNEFSENFVVFNLAFEESDPEKGGESWNFQRALGADGTIESLGEEDDGVCIVKEIQQLTLYEGIESVEIGRDYLVCKFNEIAMKKTNTDGLKIHFDIQEAQWKQLREMAEYVFLGRTFFKKS